MEIHVDYNPSPKEHYFISVHLNKKEAISFDNTLKGYRIVKQVYIRQKPIPKMQNLILNGTQLFWKMGSLRENTVLNGSIKIKLTG